MGNCLPFLFAHADADDTEQLEGGRRVSRRSSNDPTHNAQHTGSHSSSSTTHRRSRSHVSSYVNQLYSTSHDYAEERDREAMDEKRKARARALVANLRIAEYDESNTRIDECAICMLDFEPKQRIRYLPCQHAYHVECIDDWLLRSLTCPSCMEPVDSALLSAFTATAASDLKSIQKPTSAFQ